MKNRLFLGTSLCLVATCTLVNSAAPGDPKETPPASTTSRPVVPREKKAAAVSRISAEDIRGFESYSPALQAQVQKAAELTTQGLTYTFGSSDPKSGGMDCSGTIFHLLQACGFKDTPRQSDEMCRWVMHASVLYRTENATSLGETAFSALRPGDLLFWSGTYDAAATRHPPISHVMIYLGKRKSDGKPVVFGASDGRTYDGRKQCGVSVFDFALPRSGDPSAFYGYGPVPAKK